MKRDELYYLIRELITAFSAQTDNSLISTLNNYSISKDSSRKVFKDEVKTKNPKYSTLRGFLMLQNNFLRQHQQSAFYEVLDIIEELKYCFKRDTRKTIKNLSSIVILHLFVSLYFEVIFMPLNHYEDLEYIDKFIKVFSREDIIEIIKIDRFKTRYIFQDHGIDLGTMQEVEDRLNTILNEFYDPNLKSQIQ